MVKKNEKDSFDEQFNRATERGRARIKDEPRAEAVAYDERNDRIVIELSNGCTFMFPPSRVQGLRGASASSLRDVEIFGSGLDLNWRALDAQFGVASLLAGIFGTRAWMAELGRAGGSVRTEAKAAASRENGRKGGRPPRRIA